MSERNLKAISNIVASIISKDNNCSMVETSRNYIHRFADGVSISLENNKVMLSDVDKNKMTLDELVQQVADSLDNIK